MDSYLLTEVGRQEIINDVSSFVEHRFVPVDNDPDAHSDLEDYIKRKLEDYTHDETQGYY